MSIQGFGVSTSPHPESSTRPHFSTTGDATGFKKITYPGMNNKTELTYGPGGGRVKIVETVSGSITSTKQFLNGEERDGSGNVTKQFFAKGQRNGSTNYFYEIDHLASVRSMTDDSGTVQASYNFDPFGRPSKLEGAADSDFGFAGMYVHARSGLNLTPMRVYSASLGRWLSRDPSGESSGINLNIYSGNDPANSVDPLGLFEQNWNAINCIGYACGAGRMIEMSKGQSLQGFLKELGFKCKKVKSSADCKCPPGASKMMVYITHYDTNPSHLDPYRDPWVFGPGNDIHAIRQDGPSDWSYIPAIAPQGTPPTHLKSPEDYFNGANQPLAGYCCCKGACK